jgi:hypothetical protein
MATPCATTGHQWLRRLSDLRRREEDDVERGGKGAAGVAFCERQERMGQVLG